MSTKDTRTARRQRRGKVVAFTGGKRCSSCGDQVEPARARFVPKSSLCVSCARQREAAIRLDMRADRPGSVTVIR